MYASGTSGSDFLIGKLLFCGTGSQVLDGIQRLFPSPTTKHLCQYAEGETQQHPCPVHLVCHDMADATEVLSAVHPVQNRTSQEYWEDDFRCIGQNSFHATKVLQIERNTKGKLVFLCISEMPCTFERSSKVRLLIDKYQRNPNISLFSVVFLVCVRKQRYLCTGFRNIIKDYRKDNIMVVLFMVTFIVAICAAEALKANNGMNLGTK